MSRITVDVSQISAVTGHVRTTMGRIQADVIGMQTHLQGLSQTWQGGASSAFQSAAEQWVVTQRHVEESMQQINRALEMAGNQYLDVESANTRMFAG